MYAKESRVRGSFDFLNDLILRLHFGDNEKRVLSVFYDERFKVRRRKVATFQIYARLCDDQSDSDSQLDWARVSLDANQSLINLRQIKYIQEADSNDKEILPSLVGKGAVAYELTADGLEALQSIHPPVSLRLRAWIAVLPPWLVLVGSIAGGVTAIWKLIDFGVNVARHLR
jgi:hypothetical protein